MALRYLNHNLLIYSFAAEVLRQFLPQNARLSAYDAVFT